MQKDCGAVKEVNEDEESGVTVVENTPRNENGGRELGQNEKRSNRRRECRSL